MSVSVRREVSFNQGYTIIVFDKDHQYRWPTNMYEHNEIMRLYKQDGLYDGIQNDYTKWKKLLKNK